MYSQVAFNIMSLDTLSFWYVLRRCIYVWAALPFW